MIGFAAPWVLLGLAAAAIPVLLHLIARRVPPTVLFPATRYLAETARAHHRRLTLQHWLLLLVRTLLIVALVLAAAGPSLPGSGAASHAPTALAVILDNSLSSAATAGGTPVLDGLREAARSILGATHPDDALWLVTADGVPRRGGGAELQAAASAIQPSLRRLDLGLAIGTAREALSTHQLPPTVVVLSDLQRSALSPAPGAGPLVVLVPETDPVANLGISGLDPGRQPWGPEGGRLNARVEGTEGRQAMLTLRVGDRAPRQRLAAEGSTLTLASGPLTPGWWLVRAELEPDELRLDDLRYSAVRVAPAARAGWQSADRFIATAAEVLLQNGRLIRGGDLTLGILGPGASVVQPPADAATLGALNRALAARGVAWRYGGPGAGSAVTDSGPLLGRHQVFRRFVLEPAGTAGPAGGGVLLTVAGSPWIVRSGSTILLGSRLEPEWTDLPVSAEFVPFLDFLANRAVRGELAVLDAVPGDPVTLPDVATGVSRAGQVEAVEGGSGFRAREVGIHFVLAGRDTIGVVAVNPDPRESESQRAGAGEIRRIWPGARVGSLDRAAAEAFAAGGRADLRGPLLWLALTLALADAGLAAQGARRARRSGA